MGDGTGSTTHPRPRMPLVISASSVALGGGALVAAAARLPDPPTFAVFVLIASVVPWRASGLLRRAGIGAAYAVLGWSVVGLAPIVTVGGHLPGPYGGHTAIFAWSLLAAALRIGALCTEASSVWTDARWVVGTTAEVVPVATALKAALGPGVAARSTAVDAAVVALHHAAASEIPGRDAERRSFWIDVYNVLALHARRGRASRRLWSIVESYRVRYEVAGSTLSLDEIEHALLRGNRRHPAFLSMPLSESDERLPWAVDLDARIHFALNCGLRSCPPVRRYVGAGAEALEDAARSFVRDVTRIDAERMVLETTQIFEYYASDFGGPNGIRATIAHFLDVDPGEIASFELRFTPYDFTAETRFAA